MKQTALSRTVSGMRWGTLSTGVNVLFQIGFMAVMARLLSPADFGLLAIANVVLRFLSYFAQLGVSPALIQKSHLEDGDVRAALSVSLGISALCVLLAVGFAPLAQTYFSMPVLEEVIQALSLSFLLTGASAVSMGLLRREMNFKKIALIESASYVFGYGLVGVLLALANFGVWALVGAALSQAGMTTLFSYLVVRHEVAFRHRREQRMYFFKFGSRYSLIGFIEFLCSSLDAMVIGKLFGAGPAGLYSRAFLLVHLPVQQPANLLTKVLFPVISRLGIQRQADSLQISMLLVGSYAFSVSFGMIPAAHDLITVLLGDQWVEAVPLLQVLAFAVGPVYVSHVMGTTLDAMGALKPKLRIQATKLVVLILLLLALADKGPIGVVYAVVLSEWFGFLLVAGLTFSKLGAPAREWGLILGIAVTSGLATFASVWLAAWLMPEVTSSWLRLLCEVSSGAIALVVVAWLSRGALAGLPVIGELSQRLPRLGRFIPVSPPQKS